MASIRASKIVDGPAKWDLMLALFDRKTVNTRQIVFRTEDGRDLEASIASVEAEDGSGESWNLKGSFFSRARGTAPNPPVRFDMHFRTDRRQGYVSDTDEPTEHEGPHIINCDANPFVPEGWAVEEHQRGGQLTFDASQVILYLDERQKRRPWLQGHKLREELKGKPVLNANVLDHLLAHPELIPEDWKEQYTFFFGTIYRGSGGSLFVRYLYWDVGRWHWGGYWLDVDWSGSDPAALRAS